MDKIKSYVEENSTRFLNELFELIRIPSISSHPERKPDMYRCAQKWREILLAAGVDTAEVYETDGNPVTFAQKIIDPLLPTVLVYGHMDIMPVDPLDLWKTDPFEPVVKDGRIYARGANDDKGQSFMHAKALEYMVKNNELPCNIKFLFEGEEEICSPHLPDFCRKHKDMLAADVILVSDTEMLSAEIPSITTGLRGIAYWQIEVTGPDKDLHSGMYGGAVANPINTLAKLIANATDENGHITIPGFYDKVQECSAEERRKMAEAPYDEKAYRASIGVEELFGEKGYTTNERIGIRPTFDVCGIWGGYTGEGAKTILPSKAFAKLSCRLVPNQSYEEIELMIKNYFESVAPKYVKVIVTPLHSGAAYVCPIDSPAYKAAERAITDVYGKHPVPERSGGSISVIADFEEILGVKSVLMGFGLKSDSIHSPNESFSLEQFYKGIMTIPRFYKYFVEQYKK